MRSRNDLPGSCVTWTTSWSERSFVPPVTAERSPPDSRMTGADSPVIADSSTEPTPSMISPSAGMISPAETTTTSPRLQLGRRHVLEPAAVRPAVRDRRRAGGAERVGLRLAAALGDRLGEVREQDRQPEPEGDHAHEPELRRTALARGRGRRSTVVITLPSSTMNMTGFLTCSRGSSFGNESRIAARTISREKTLASCAPLAPVSRSSARLSSRTLTPGSPKKPSERPSVFSSISVLNRRERQLAHGRDAVRLELRVGGRDVGVDPGAGGRHGVDRDVVDRQARVVRAARASGSPRLLPDVLGEVGVRRPEVRRRSFRRRCRRARSPRAAGGSSAAS